MQSLLNKYRPGDARQTGSVLTILELINYRLLPFYRSVFFYLRVENHVGII